MSRVRQTFGEKNEWGNPVVEVRGPHNRASNQWYLTMLPLAGEITLSWRNNPERARRELAALRAMAKANQITRTERGRYAAHSLSHSHLEKDDQGDHPDHPDLSPDGGPKDRGDAAKDRPKDRPGSVAAEPKDRGDRGDRPNSNFDAAKDRPPGGQGRSLGDLSGGADGAEEACPECGRGLVERICWPCRDRACRVCGEPTGSALRAYCVFCPEGT